MLKKYLVCIFLVLTSCRHKPIQSLTPITNDENLSLTDYSILANCVLYNSKGEFIRFLNGALCLIESNGNTFIYKHDSLGYYNKNFDLIWDKESLLLHHQLKFSYDTKSLLSISSAYTPDKKLKQIRHDNLLVLNRNGQLLKKFDFKKYHKKNKTDKSPYINNWSTDGNKDKSHEITHINSFSEITSLHSNVQKLTGYVAHCNLQRKIYILNDQLTQVVETIDTGLLNIHDVQPYKQGQLLFYLNENSSDAIPRLSSIAVYDLNTKKLSTLYGPFNEQLSSQACSSVQVLPNDYLFILHSKCLPKNKNKSFEDFYFELVNLKTKKNRILTVKNMQSPQGAILIKAAEYLKNNIGL